MAAKMAAVGGIETEFRYISKGIWGREKCDICFYPRKSQGINMWPLYTDEINPWWLKPTLAPIAIHYNRLFEDYAVYIVVCEGSWCHKVNPIRYHYVNKANEYSFKGKLHNFIVHVLN